MPIILQNSPPTPIATLARPRTLDVNAGVILGSRPNMRRTRSLFANGSLLIPASATLARTRDLYAFGRMLGEPNEFGSATLARSRNAVLDAMVLIGGKAILPRVRDLTITPRVQPADSDTLTIMLTIGNPPNNGFGATYSARILADGVGYKIKTIEYTEDRNAVGVELAATLVKPSDRVAIEAATAWKFEIYDGNAWVTMFESGRRTGLGFSFAFADGRPGDGLSISTNSALEKQLEKSPSRNTTVYDSARMTLNAADFESIPDASGFRYTQTLVPIGLLDLYSLLGYAFGLCGFDGFQSTIPNKPVRRADFRMTETFYDGLTPHIGAFSPLLFVRNNVVWLLDSTQKFPAGFGSPIPLLAKDYINAQFQETRTEIDAFVVEYSDSDSDFDYSTDETIDDPTETHGDFGTSNYTESTRSRTYRHFYKATNPLVPVRTEKIKEINSISAVVNGSFRATSTTSEDITFDTFGRPKRIRKEQTGLVPDLDDPLFPVLERTIKTEKTQFLYGPDRFAPLRDVLKQTIKETSGLITIDEGNEHLGKPFKQEFGDGFQAGNLSEGLTVVEAFIKTETETIEQTDKRQNEIRQKIVNFLTDPPTVTTPPADIRSGDNSTNGRAGATHEVIVFRSGSTRTDAKMQSLSVGELPVKLAIPLAQRRLERQVIRRGSITLKGLNLAIGRGTMFELFDRDGNSVGKFLCEGRSISGQNLGQRTQATRQTLEVIEI